MGMSWVPGAGAVGPGLSVPGPSVCPEQMLEGPRPDEGRGVPSAPRPTAAEPRVSRTPTPKWSSLGVGSSSSLSPVSLYLQVPMRPWQASARMCVLQPTPGQAHCSRPEEKARGPVARTEGPGTRTPGPHGRPGAPGLMEGPAAAAGLDSRPASEQTAEERRLAGTPRPLRRITGRESQARLGFHCTFIPCFTPCIP